MTEHDLQKFRAYLRKSVGESSVTTYARIVALALTTHPEDPMKLMLQRHLSNATRHTYQAALRHWADFTDDKPLGERLRSKELRRTMKDNRRTEHAKRDRHVVRPFSAEEERRIYTALRQWRDDASRPVWQWPAMSMMFMLGLRAGVDLAYLARKDVEAALRSGVELVIVTKGAKERTLPAVLVLDELRTLLAVEQEWEILADLIVSGRAPDSPRKVANAYEHLRLCVKKLADEVGIAPGELHPHRFRHSAANRLYEATKDIKKVQEFLGHESLNTTLGYLKKNRTAEIGQDLLTAMRRGLEE